MSVKILAQQTNDLPLTGSNPCNQQSLYYLPEALTTDIVFCFVFFLFQISEDKACLPSISSPVTGQLQFITSVPPLKTSEKKRQKFINIT
jgi:hypothetical protein